MKKLFTLLTLAGAFLVANAATEKVFEQNFAQLAVDNIDYGGTDLKVIRNTNNKITIGSNSTYPFTISDANENVILKESILSESLSDMLLRYNNTSNIGLYARNTGNTIGISELKAGDVVEIAYRGSDITPSALVNLSEPQANGTYTFEFYYNQNRTLVYNIFTMTVQEDGVAGFTLDGVYYAYIAVNRESSKEPEEPGISSGTIFEVNFAQLSNDKIGYSGTDIKPVRNTTDRRDVGTTGTYPFTITFTDETQLDESILSISRDDMLLRFNGTSNLGLYARNTGNTFGLIELLKGDVVEIAYKASSGDLPSISSTSLVNLSEPEANGTYTFEYYINSDRTTDYSIYTMTVQEDGIAGFVLDGVYIAYIKVTRKAEDPEEGNITIEFGSDNIEGQVKEDGSIYAKTTGETARIYVRINGATENSIVKYMVEETVEGISLYSETSDFNTASYDSEQQAHYIDLPKGKGKLTISYKKDENSEEIVSEPIAYQIDFTTAVETIEITDGEAVYYNLHGVKVQNPDHGIFIKVQNGKASKVIL